MALRSKDLFEDSSMSFGDHLEELRYYMIRALIGVIIVSGFTLSFGNTLVGIVRAPIDRALMRHGLSNHKIDDLGTESFWERFVTWYNTPTSEEVEEGEAEAVRNVKKQIPGAKMQGKQIDVTIPKADLLLALHAADPERFELPKEGDEPDDNQIILKLSAPEFSIFRDVVKRSNRPVTLNVQEAFMTYIKVALVSGVVLASPWIFYNAWMFVAVGLYPHERKYVHVYGSMSLVLFLMGATFCFYIVFPFVLEFLLSFNGWLEVQPQIRLSEWVSFAVFLPLMFGVSFQLPLVMVFLNRLSLFSVTVYREQRRMAVLVIAGLSMMLTPSDPSSMLLMMIPLIILYELGIWLCTFNPIDNPFREEELA